MASNPVWRMICSFERGGSVCFPVFPTKPFDLLGHALASWNRGKRLGPLFELGPVDFCPLAPDHRRDVFEIAVFRAPRPGGGVGTRARILRVDYSQRE